jgi:hypothetical protein
MQRSTASHEGNPEEGIMVLENLHFWEATPKICFFGLSSPK